MNIYLTNTYNKEYMKYSLIFLILIFSISVSAAPPITSEFVGDIGLDIQANIFDYYKTNTAAELHIHVFNISNGVLLSNDTTSCEVELTNGTGGVILSGTPVADDNHFKMSRNSSIVTEEGIYGVSIVCNSSGIAGFKTHFFEATSTGNATPENFVIFQGLFIFIIFGITCFFLVMSFSFNEVGFKIFFLVISFIFLMASMIQSFIIMLEYNVSASINSTTLSLIIVMGTIIILLFIYFLIRQTINVLDMFRISRGLKIEENVGLGSSVGGYNTKRAY